MERKTFRILFLLRKARIGKNGLAPILVRITTGRLHSEIYIQCHANPTKWNQAKERVTVSDKLSVQVNATIDNSEHKSWRSAGCSKLRDMKVMPSR